MLISKVTEPVGEGRHDGGAAGEDGDHSQEYQTAHELFELMAKNHPYNDSVGDCLSATDLVILYKNIEIGTKLMTDAECVQRRRPNQHVETVVYRDARDSDGSDTSDIYPEEVQNSFLINKERRNLLNSQPSLENTLCHKLGELEIQSSSVSNSYVKQFLFKDTSLKEQLENLSLIKNSCNELDGSILPASLLDYICCKRLEDNYNFYMDNVIRYVKHTIDQLKRISNGEYLTDKAKEKWREVENVTKQNSINNMRVLATSASIPLQVERKINGSTSMWDDVIHSEVDVRSLSKILEKKIIVEVPKVICGSYKFFSKMCPKKLLVSCQKEDGKESNSNKDIKEPRVDVVLQLSRSESGEVMSNINSIMILQAHPQVQYDENGASSLVPYTSKQTSEFKEEPIQIAKIVEIEEVIDEENEVIDDEINANSNNNTKYTSSDVSDDCNEANDDSPIYLSDELEPVTKTTLSIQTPPNESAHLQAQSSNHLALSMYKMNMDSLAEENYKEFPELVNKKKSPTKVRVKSPYENKSYYIEEKKRKRLLEIREKREKRKMAMNENSKITKHRYGKGPLMAQASNSVTKLSITNKSFYNSIYGQTIAIDKPIKSKTSRRDESNDSLDKIHGEPVSQTPERNKKYINRSYYLDEAVTEMMYTQQSDCSSEVKELFSACTSDASNELNLGSPCILSERCSYSKDDDAVDENKSNEDIEEDLCEALRNVDNNVVPSNTPTGNEFTDDAKKTTNECRKSIDKIYDLLKKLRKVENVEASSSIPKFSTTCDTTDAKVGHGSSIVQGSDSGTSLKHQLTSSNPSSFCFDKVQSPINALKSNLKKKQNNLTTLVPKVIISTKQLSPKAEIDKSRKERKKVSLSPVTKCTDNPLKAISQLLHEFDNVQKNRQKSSSDSKPVKKIEFSLENRNISRPNSLKKRTRIEQPVRELDSEKVIKMITQKDRKIKSHLQTELPKGHSSMNEGKPLERIPRKKISDIIDEVKEAKGEAVRGPPKFNSRLNSLAQPKKAYVQAHSEEYQTKYGRNLMADRLQRLATAKTTTQNVDRQGSAGAKGKLRRNDPNAVSSSSVRQTPSPLPSIERWNRRRSASPPERPTEFYEPTYTLDTPEIQFFDKNKSLSTESRAGGPGRRGAGHARVPLVPVDADSASPSSTIEAESTAIGSKLHRMVTKMLSSKPAALAVLSESPESSNRSAQHFTNVDYRLQNANISSVDSLSGTDIFADNNVKTAVEDFSQNKQELDVEEEIDNASETSIALIGDVKSDKSDYRLRRQISVGAFQNYLKIKNATLSPKQSTRQMFWLQSGDARSLMLDSSVSRRLKLSGSHSARETNLKTLPSLTEAQLGWNVPKLQITTVGYAFPKYNINECGSKLGIESLHNIFTRVSTRDTSLKEEKPNKQLVYDRNGQAENDMGSTTEITRNIIDATKKLVVDKNTKIDEREISTENNNVDINNKIVVDEKVDHVSCTSSLDVLVGLLNEIQKLTACHITSTENYTQNQGQFGAIKLINNGVPDISIEKNNCHDLVSITSLDKMRQLESSHSIYSFYISNEASDFDDYEIPKFIPGMQDMIFEKTCCTDREVSAIFPIRECNDTFTDVPSIQFPVKIAHSTNVTSSLLNLKSRSSSETMFSFNDQDSVNSFNIFNSKCKSIDSSDQYSNPTKASETNSEANHINTELVKKEKKLSDIWIESKTVNTDLIQYKSKSIDYLKHKGSTSASGLDPLFKMKRDILVTVYSMLVLTVFAALSFPEILYYA